MSEREGFPIFTSSDYGTGFARPQAQRPPRDAMSEREGSLLLTSRGRGSGSASPQVQRPPRGAGSYTQ